MESAEQAITEMGKVGERTLQDGIGKVVEEQVCCPSRLIRALEIGTSIGWLICDGLLPCD